MDRTLVSLAVGAALLAAMPAKAQPNAADYPNKPIRVVVTVPAGGGVDTVTRLVTERMRTIVGQPFVVENKGGAGTSLGSYLAAKADPDGYTILVNSTSHVVVASTYAKLPYSVADDFAPITAIADMPFLVGTNTTKMRDFVTPSTPLQVHAEMLGDGSGYAVTKAFITREGKKVAEAEIKFAVKTFPDPKFATMIREWGERLQFPFDALEAA